MNERDKQKQHKHTNHTQKRRDLRATGCSDEGTNSQGNFHGANDSPTGFPDAVPPSCRKCFARDLPCVMIEDRIFRRRQSVTNDKLLNIDRDTGFRADKNWKTKLYLKSVRVALALSLTSFGCMETVIGRNSFDLCCQLGAGQDCFVSIYFFDGIAERQLLNVIARME